MTKKLYDQEHLGIAYNRPTVAYWTVGSTKNDQSKAKMQVYNVRRLYRACQQENRANKLDILGLWWPILLWEIYQPAEFGSSLDQIHL